jgi:hypothetical protein
MIKALPGEALAKEVVRLVGDARAVAGGYREERGWPRAVGRRAEAALEIGEGGRHLVLRQVPDQAQQLVTLGAHA